MAGSRPVLPIDGRRRSTRFRRRPAATRTPAAAVPGGGRAWINGREVGGTDPRYAHLDRSYD